MTVNTLGSHEQVPSQTVASRMWRCAPIGVAAISLFALVYYQLKRTQIDVRTPLQQLYAGIYDVFGFAPSVMFFGLLLIWSTIWVATGRFERAVTMVLRLVAMLLMLGIFINLGDAADGVAPKAHKGALGAWLAENMVSTFGYFASLVLVSAVTLASALLATDFLFADAFERLRPKAAKAPDAGVEPAVTDHLRGLSSAVARGPAPAAAPSTGTAAAVAELEIEVDDETDFVAETEPEESESEPVRRPSWEQRRAERRARWEVEPQVADEAPAAAAPATEEATGEEPVESEPPPAEPVGETDDVAAPPAAGPAVAASAGDEPAPVPSDEASLAPPADETPFAELYETAEAIDAEDLDAAEEEIVEVAAAEPLAAAEPTVSIPRPEPEPEPEPEQREPEPEPQLAAEAAVPVAEAEGDDEPRKKQQQLFGSGGVDDNLVQDAIDLVTGSRRASATFLQRKLRIDYTLAVDVLAELAARGVVAIDGDATQGRVLG